MTKANSLVVSIRGTSQNRRSGDHWRDENYGMIEVAVRDFMGVASGNFRVSDPPKERY